MVCNGYLPERSINTPLGTIPVKQPRGRDRRPEVEQEKFSSEHAVMVWDGAGFHTSGSLVVPQDVTLVKLPPYSPELNPIENLWHYLKSHFWSNRDYADYADLEKAAINAWRTAVLDQVLVKSVCAAPYAEKSSNAQL